MKRLKPFTRLFFLIFAIGLLAGCGGGGGSAAPVANPAAGSAWDQMAWDQGTWG
ncbi:MAG: hypothetical protein HYR79_02710 [Nitrospirae bacterium]|nr:hypothetical protein [Nitrospirota bacterium]